MDVKNKQNNIFSNTEIQNFVGFYDAIKKVHNRLIREGYIVKGGKIIKPRINNG